LNSGYLKKLHSQDWETKVYYRRKVTQEYFKSKMGNIEYLKEFFERFKKEYSDITFDPKEWIKNKDGDVVRKK